MPMPHLSGLYHAHKLRDKGTTSLRYKGHPEDSQRKERESACTGIQRMVGPGKSWYVLIGGSNAHAPCIWTSSRSEYVSKKRG